MSKWGDDVSTPKDRLSRVWVTTRKEDRKNSRNLRYDIRRCMSVNVGGWRRKEKCETVRRAVRFL